jgi:outer membrane protein OmpA-like peptidoglycan-associated protein
MIYNEHAPPDAALRAGRSASPSHHSAGRSHQAAARCVSTGAALGTALIFLAGCTAASTSRKADPIVIAATATANEPAPALSSVDLALLRNAGNTSANAVAYVVNPASGEPVRQSLTPRRANGEVEYGPQRSALLAANLTRIKALLGKEAATGSFDLLDTMLAASRVTSSPATMLLLSSGVTTAGGLDLREVGWDADPATVAAQLKQRGLLPDLSGWSVIFSGLAVTTTAPQPKLQLPQQTTLGAYWMAICHAARAAACRIDASPRALHPSRSSVPVPVVPVPAVQSVTGPHSQDETILPSDLLFAFGSASLLPGASKYLAPVARRARTAGLWMSITGQASPDGGSASLNLTLSLARARAVAAQLAALGVPTSKITQVKGIGTASRSCTVDGVLDEARCAQLRRVVIVLSRRPVAAS